MAEADITTLAGLSDGSAWGPAGRGAFATLQTRVKPIETQAVIVLGAAGPVNVNWANGNHHKVTSAGFNVTDVTTTGGPANGSIRVGSLEVHNTGGVEITVATASLGANGLASPMPVPAGKTRTLFLLQSGTVET